MTTEWEIRPYRTPAFVRDVVNPHPKAGEIEIGDNLILHPKGQPEEGVCVHLTEGDPGGKMLGVVARANRLGAGGDKRFAKGVSVAFEEKHVFRLEKTTGTP